MAYMPLSINNLSMKHSYLVKAHSFTTVVFLARIRQTAIITEIAETGRVTGKYKKLFLVHLF